MNRRLDQIKRRNAAWMLLAIFVWILQPVGTNLFCHDHSSHDHSAHASGTQNGEAHEHTAPHTHYTAHDAASTPDIHEAPSQPSEPAHEACCCQPQQNSVAVTAAASYSGFNCKNGVIAPHVAVVPLTYEPEALPTISSRAGPGVPALNSQFRHFSFSNRAPPFLP